MTVGKYYFLQLFFFRSRWRWNVEGLGMSTVLRGCEHRVADRYCTRRIYLIIMSDAIISKKPPPSICRPPITHTHTTTVFYSPIWRRSLIDIYFRLFQVSFEPLVADRTAGLWRHGAVRNLTALVSSRFERGGARTEFLKISNFYARTDPIRPSPLEYARTSVLNTGQRERKRQYRNVRRYLNFCFTQQ